MPGLLRGMARTAVIAGTATAVSNGVSRRQMRRWDNQEEQAYAEQQQQQQAATAPATDPTIAQLEQLAQLRDQGILTNEEFEAKKKQILGI
ncbi:MAG: SHOCT domain-containing protein [Candidatus Saccharimonadales bacterium]